MEENNEDKQSSARWKIVGINLLVLLGYTIICRFIEGGIILDAFMIGVHFVGGVLTAIIVRRWEWALSAFLILAIGFSTCVTLLDMPNMH